MQSAEAREALIYSIENKSVPPYCKPSRSNSKSYERWSGATMISVKVNQRCPKTHFSSVLRDVEAGNEIAIAYGKKRQTIAVIIPYEKMKNKSVLL